MFWMALSEMLSNNIILPAGNLESEEQYVGKYTNLLGCTKFTCDEIVCAGLLIVKVTNVNLVL